MTTYRIARNSKTTLYEVHADGCKHLIAPHFDNVSSPVAGTSGQTVAADFEARNDDCYAKIGPCAKAAK